MIGSRMKQARLASGLTLDELAQKMEAEGQPITKAGLSKYELSKSTPSQGFLVVLARVLKIRTSYFQETDPIQIEWIGFRKRSTMPVKKQEQVQAFATQVVESQVWLQQLLYPKLKPSIPKARKATDFDDADAAAAELRKAWNLDESPIDSLTAVVEDHGGVVVACDDISDDFDGLAGTTTAGFPVAVVSMTTPDDRRRYSLAHEIGHLLLQCKDVKLAEQLCNRFASALLVPPSVVRSELGTKRRRLDIGELGLLKKKHGLSMQGWIRYARDLDIIEESQYKNLCITFSSNHWKKVEPVDFHGNEVPSRLRQMTLRAYSEGIISAMRADQIVPGCAQAMTPSKDDKSLSLAEIRRLPREQRAALLSAAADLAEAEYKNNRELTSFDAYGEDDLYVSGAKPQKG